LEGGFRCWVAYRAVVEIDYVAVFCRFGCMVSNKICLHLELLQRVEKERHTIVGLHTHIFPETLLHCCTGLHVACSHVLPTLEELGLPPTAIGSLTRLRDCRHGRWGRGACCCDRQRCGASGRRGMKALGEWCGDQRSRSRTCSKDSRRYQRCDTTHPQLVESLDMARQSV